MASTYRLSENVFNSGDSTSVRVLIETRNALMRYAAECRRSLSLSKSDTYHLVMRKPLTKLLASVLDTLRSGKTHERYYARCWHMHKQHCICRQDIYGASRSMLF